MAHFNESNLEMAIMELFENEGYIYHSGKTILKEETDVLLCDDLRQYLNDRYKAEGITTVEIERAINILTTDAGVSIFDHYAIKLRFIMKSGLVKRKKSRLFD